MDTDHVSGRSRFGLAHPNFKPASFSPQARYHCRALPAPAMAFTAPSPVRLRVCLSRAQSASSPPRRQRRLASRPPPAVIMSQPSFKDASVASQQTWEDAYKAYLLRSGEAACILAMDGFDAQGRGAVFVVDRPETAGSVGVVGADGLVQDGIATVFVSLDELQRRDSTVHEQMEPIVSRMRLYNPVTQFVIVFEIQSRSGGLQGADIVTPKSMPVRPHEK